MGNMERCKEVVLTFKFSQSKNFFKKDDYLYYL